MKKLWLFPQTTVICGEGVNDGDIKIGALQT